MAMPEAIAPSIAMPIPTPGTTRPEALDPASVALAEPEPEALGAEVTEPVPAAPASLRRLEQPEGEEVAVLVEALPLKPQPLGTALA
jgi:hypothetical protein